MKYLILALCLTGCTWFTKTSCEMGKVAAGAGTVAVGAVLGCTGTDAMVADMQKLIMAQTSVCGEETITAGQVADLVCPVMGEYAIKAALEKLPATWKCAGNTIVTEAAKTQIITFCKQALPY